MIWVANGYEKEEKSNEQSSAKFTLLLLSGAKTEPQHCHPPKRISAETRIKPESWEQTATSICN